MIVVIKSEDGYFHIASDSRRILGGIKFDQIEEENLPVFRTETDKNLILGVNYRNNIPYLQALKYILNDPKIRTLNENTVYNNFIKDLLGNLASVRVLKNNKDATLPGAIILAKGKHAFGVEAHCSLYEINEFEVIGDGAEFAISSLEKTRGKPIVYRLARAFIEASNKTNLVGRSFVVLHTKPDKKPDSVFKEEKYLIQCPELKEFIKN